VDLGAGAIARTAVLSVFGGGDWVLAGGGCVRGAGGRVLVGDCVRGSACVLAGGDAALAGGGSVLAAAVRVRDGGDLVLADAPVMAGRTVITRV